MLLLAISGLLTTATVNAQNFSCQGSFGELTAVNSTGQHEFTWNASYAGDDPWYVSVLVGSRYNDLQGFAYISVPGTVPNRTDLCIYQYQNINATLEAGGENSCSGVISSNCMDHLTEALSDTAYNCPRDDTSSVSEEFKKACPMLKGGSHSTFPPSNLYKPSLCSFLFPSRTEQMQLTSDSESAAFVHLADKLAQTPSVKT